MRKRLRFSTDFMEKLEKFWIWLLLLWSEVRKDKFRRFQRAKFGQKWILVHFWNLSLLKNEISAANSVQKCKVMFLTSPKSVQNQNSKSKFWVNLDKFDNLSLHKSKICQNFKTSPISGNSNQSFERPNFQDWSNLPLIFHSKLIFPFQT